MTNLKNINEVSFPDDGVSVICVIVHIVMLFFFLFLFSFLFLVGVGRPSGGDTHEHYPYTVAAISKKESKLYGFFSLFVDCYRIDLIAWVSVDDLQLIAG